MDEENINDLGPCGSHIDANVNHDDHSNPHEACKLGTI